MVDKVTVLKKNKKNMSLWHESKIWRICQKFHLNSKILCCKPSVTVLMLIKGISVIFQQGLKQVLLKHCDFIAPSWEVGWMNQCNVG